MQSRELCLKYLDIYEKIHDCSADHAMEAIYFLSGTFDEVPFSTAVMFLLRMDIMSGKWDMFERYFHCIKWDQSAPYDSIQYEKDLLYVMSATAYSSHMKEMVNAFYKDRHSREILFNYINDLGENNVDGRWNIVQAMSDNDLQDEERLPDDIFNLIGTYRKHCGEDKVENEWKNDTDISEIEKEILLSVSILSSCRSESVE